MAIKDKISSPLGICFIYIVVSFLVILGFRFVFPEQPAPLRNFSIPWRISRGILSCIGLFPALALSALVIPFGFKDHDGKSFARFSPRFIELLKAPIIAAVALTILYGLLFFLALPVVWGFQSNMRSEGQLYRLSRARAEECAAGGAWPEAAQFVALCDRIWPDGPDIETLRTEVSIGLNEYFIALSESPVPDETAPAQQGIPGRGNPVNAAEALALADTALRERRYYDAHWLASLAGRLARNGSAEDAEAARVASIAWNAVSSLEPNDLQSQTHALYRLKREGYEAMTSEDWVHAYYVFKELSERTPADPDVAHFLVMSERGVASLAFFTDEMERAVGDRLAGAVFSLPGTEGGRIVLRLSALSTFPDFSFGSGVELAAYDRDGGFSYGFRTPYTKILPVQMGRPRVVLLLRALDRQDERLRWEPEWTGSGETGAVQIVLDAAYEDLLLLAKVMRGLDDLLIGDLFAAAKNTRPYGYIPQVFQAEILRRFAEPVFFLSAAILGIVTGWRFRARKRPRYVGIPMLVILPLVFNGVVHLYRSIINTLAIELVISLSFTAALAVFTAAAVTAFILSLITLAAQHG
ncbi:MAG: hypothetical protein LBP32_03015 [Spirochaetaceae bacterium]|jgi:hypothetical protein|nr:hypothetical protein [Spirochaetaceae bacterium]